MSGVEGPGLVSARRNARLAQLHDLLRRGGPTRLREAATALGVSSMTLRRDLAAPGQPFVLLGGHVLPLPGDTLSGEVPPSEGWAGETPPGEGSHRARYVLEHEQDTHAEGKRRAARHAAALVHEGDTIFIDCGTTTPHLAEALPPGIPLTVLCYALNVAAILSRRPRTQLILLGGLFHPASASFASEEALNTLRRLRINTAFISAGGVHAMRGVTCTNFHEVAVKQVAMGSAARSVLVVDSSKFGRLRPAFFAPVAAFERVVANPPVRPRVATLLHEAGSRLDLAAGGEA
ncbi:DeoR family transcriptional regulator [Roseomonas elaeocarpi]|uniref:DeoR family transcriptional regulator n=1 Tax=Roseomonas elaeocarpi TaxID=907779 RepID=A0ABV6JMJ5_9PROT